MALAVVSGPLMALSGHFDGSSECPSGHRAELSQCLLLTQSGGTLPCPGLGGDNETARFTAPGVGVLVAGSRGSIALRQADRVSNLSANRVVVNSSKAGHRLFVIALVAMHRFHDDTAFLFTDSLTKLTPGSFGSDVIVKPSSAHIRNIMVFSLRT